MSPSEARLPDLPALRTDGARAVLAALDAGAGASRLVGGAVRDALLGLPVADLDVATRFTPQQVIERLEAAAIKAVPTGVAHGTVTAVTPDGPVEVTTLRRDVDTDGRHATIAYTDDWAEDAARRDFTINALYADPTSGEVFDMVGGLADLAARRVRFIGDPLKRIAEDHLRILRFFRFHARFGAAFDPASLDACAARANDLMALSRERIRDELLKLLRVADPVPTIRIMVERGILRPILPEAEDVEGLARMVARESSFDRPAAALRRLAALMPREAAPLEGLGTRLRLSNADRKRLTAMAGAGDHDDPRAAAYRQGVDTAVDRALLADGDPTRAMAALGGWSPPRLPLAGRDLIARGVAPGPAVSRALRAFEEMWIAAGFPGDRAAIEALAQAAARDTI